MTTWHTSGLAEWALPWLLLLYCVASLLHFVHNAEYVADYPPVLLVPPILVTLRAASFEAKRWQESDFAE